MGGESSASSLAPGFRFHPTDEELVSYYLKRKICGKPFRFDAISEIDIYKFEPWDLPGQSRLKSRDREWYFFSALDKKYGNGWRTNRATEQGYWKTTGKDRAVHRATRSVGMKKTLVYHIGRAPRGERTNWVMHEYRIEDETLGKAKDAFVLCRIFQKSGTGPKNGEQYGAPFIEEEWDEDVTVPEQEVMANGGSSNGSDEETSRAHNSGEESVALMVPPLNAALPVNPCCQNVWNAIQDPLDTLGEDQKLPIASAASAENGLASASASADNGLVEFPVDNEFFDIPKEFKMEQTPVNNEFFDISKEFKMEQTPVKNEFLELSDLSNSMDAGNFSDDQATRELSYFAGPSNLDVNGGSYIEMKDLANCSEVADPFDMLDANFFDATNDFLNDEDYSALFSDEPFTSDPLFFREELGPAFPEPSKPHASEFASSSVLKPEKLEKVPRDVNYDEGWENSIAKQVSRMLGTIPAPPAFAAEFPTKEAILGQTSTSVSSSSIHVTAGMIHITSSMTVSGNGKDDWIWRKNGGVDVLLPYGLTTNDAMTMEHLMSSKAVSVVARSSFYLIFLWVLILSVSCKIGSYIYTK